MKELLRTNDPVLLSCLQSALDDAGIEWLLFDQYVSAVEGSIGVMPRRMMVLDSDLWRASHILEALRAEANDRND